MSDHRSTTPVVPLALVFLILAAAPALAGGDEWRVVDPAQLALKAPTVEKEADAEAIFWEVRVEKKFDSAVLFHYLRIKIFTERGRDAQSKVELPFLNGSKIRDVAGRTIKPDGTIIDLKPEAILDQMIARAGKVKLQAKTFSLPGVEPGAIIEYRWVEEQKSSYLSRLYFQRDIPVQMVKYDIKVADSNYSLSMLFFNMNDHRSESGEKGLQTITMANVPALRSEPYMPPENEVRSWMLVYCTTPESEFGVWPRIAKAMYEESKSRTKVNDEIRRTAIEAIGDASSSGEKLKRLFDFCRAKIKNVNDDASGLSADDLARLKENKSAVDTLRRGSGSGYDINMLFAALATAAGFDARYARVADRSDIFFDRNLVMPYFLTAYNIAVRVGGNWVFFDPGSTHVPYGMLRWQEEGSEALLSDPFSHAFVRTPLSPPEKSQTKSVATLRLSEDGTLEGKVRQEMTGHIGARLREATDQDSPAEREKTVGEAVKKQITTAELSAIEVENLTDAAKPLVLSYQIRVTGYAQRTGKRLFLQPAFFEYGVKPTFSASERRYPVYFHYGWSEEEQVTIELPAGFDVDNIEMPVPFRVEGVSQYDLQLRYDESRRALIYTRSFFFGSNGNLLFPGRNSEAKVETVYPQVKRVFDLIHSRDSHTITLKAKSEK